MEPRMHPDAPRWPESGMPVQREYRPADHARPRRPDGPCPIGVHRCASAVPFCCFAAACSRLPARRWAPAAAHATLPRPAPGPQAAAAPLRCVARPHAPIHALTWRRAVSPGTKRDVHETEQGRPSRDRLQPYSGPVGTATPVMAGPDAAILPQATGRLPWRPRSSCVDGRVKSGHDGRPIAALTGAARECLWRADPIALAASRLDQRVKWPGTRLSRSRGRV